ncbi:DUF1850 domain-containing protein [Desulforhopalus singaporensis]|uniref:DUF1850 domain-containing protein n=1 Tax=Desulforhopalus singaporensis TaxID=91360 RepID=UPI0015A1155D|nr:DUF1850 domain-containing protein [Desulforhopalus singaporensis]
MKAISHRPEKFRLTIAWLTITLSSLLIAAAIKPTNASELFLVFAKEQKQEKPVLQIPISYGEEFVLTYLHSYSKFPVHEHYRLISASQIELTRIVQRASQCSDIIFSQVNLREDGWLEMVPKNRITNEISFVAGSPDLGNHKVQVGLKQWRLSDWYEGGDVVVIRAEEH